MFEDAGIDPETYAEENDLTLYIVDYRNTVNIYNVWMCKKDNWEAIKLSLEGEKNQKGSYYTPKRVVQNMMSGVFLEKR